MTKEEQEELSQTLEGYIELFSRVPPAPCDPIISTSEKQAALIWAGAAVVRWLRAKKGKQLVRVISFERWFEKSKRDGKLMLAVLDGKKKVYVDLMVGPLTARYLKLIIPPDPDADPYLNESGVSFSAGIDWKIEVLPQDSNAKCAKGI